MKEFQTLTEEQNRKEKKYLTVHIAHGFAVCEDVSDEGIEQAIAKADSAMYQNKTKLKSKA